VPRGGNPLCRAGLHEGELTRKHLYQLIRQPKPIVERRLDIELLDSGAEAFSFTFG
jgi:hypothetical protein